MNCCVPLSDKIIRRYNSTSELPGHDIMDKSLHTGKLTVTIKAETPIFVADTSGFGFFMDGSGNYAIPGSTIRGFVRSAMQVLGFGVFRSDDIDLQKDIHWRGMPETHRTLLENKDFLCLDYVWSIMGFISKKYCYRSRVTFEDFTLVGKAEIDAHIFPGYKSQAFDGYKVPAAQEGIEERERWEDTNFRRKNLQMLKNASFQGTIRFVNLTDDELGLLLWSIKLEDGCYHSVGQGKSFGYGRVSVNIAEAVEYSTSDLYSGFPLGWNGQVLAVKGYIDAYKAYAKEQIHTQDILDTVAIKKYLEYTSLKKSIHAQRF